MEWNGFSLLGLFFLNESNENKYNNKEFDSFFWFEPNKLDNYRLFYFFFFLFFVLIPFPFFNLNQIVAYYDLSIFMNNFLKQEIIILLKLQP